MDLKKPKFIVYGLVSLAILGAFLGFHLYQKHSLFYNITNLNVQQVERLLKEQKCNVNQHWNGFNGLHFAMMAGKYEGSRPAVIRIAALLIAHGIDVNAVYGNGLSALHDAILLSYDEITVMLIQNGADVNLKEGIDGYRPLHFAAQKGNLDIVKLLVSHGADINAANQDSETPLHEAVGSRKLDVVRYLVEQGADTEARNRSGETPYELAVRIGARAIADYLGTVQSDTIQKRKQNSIADEQ